LPEKLRNSLIHKAAAGLLVIGYQLKELLDAYDFFAERYPPESLSDEMVLRDLEISIIALGYLPHQVAATVTAWQKNEEQELSVMGFEVNVLNELAVHLHTISSFMTTRDVKIDYKPLLINEAFTALRVANRLIAHSRTA